MATQNKRRLGAILPWLLTIAILAVFTLVSLDRQTRNPFETQQLKVNLLSAMKIHLLEAIDAEKNAVLAVTDAASEQFAGESRQAAARVENSRKDLEAILQREKSTRETALLNEFNGCWSQFKKLDETVLNLATQNTNLKAQRISATQCADEMERFETHLNRLIQRNAQGGCRAAGLSYAALTAGLKILSVHKIHIEERDDRAMDRIEQRIKSYDDAARNALRQLHRIGGLDSNRDLQAAEAAYERFMRFTGEVLTLSRMNTNLKAAELSLSQNSVTAAQCQVILSTLKDSVVAQGNYLLPRSKIKAGE